MKHPACHFSVLNLSRGKTAGAVARAAYIARCRLHDERIGKTFSYGHLSGLLADGTVNWVSGSELLWNEVEAAETRKNSRVAREIRVALPAELPLGEMRRLIHGYCCNLKDRYGVVSQYAIHAPAFLDDEDGKEVELQYQGGQLNLEEFVLILSDSNRTNLNFHAHILVSTREKDRSSGHFGAKVRCLDSIKTGPEEIQAMRIEWELRANSALRRMGSRTRIDLRSYKEMAIAGDAPEGLNPQKHLGPKAANAAKKIPFKNMPKVHPKHSLAEEEEPFPAIEALVDVRKKYKAENDDLWTAWVGLRDLQRQKARLEFSERIATEREAQRKKEAARDKENISKATSAKDAQAAAAEAVSIAAPRGGLADIIARVQGGEEMVMPEGEDCVIDPETYQRAGSTTPFEESIRIQNTSRVLVRTRNS